MLRPELWSDCSLSVNERALTKHLRCVGAVSGTEYMTMNKITQSSSQSNSQLKVQALNVFDIAQHNNQEAGDTSESARSSFS